MIFFQKVLFFDVVSQEFDLKLVKFDKIDYICHVTCIFVHIRTINYRTNLNNSMFNQKKKKKKNKIRNQKIIFVPICRYFQIFICNYLLSIAIHSDVLCLFVYRKCAILYIIFMKNFICL